MSRPPPGTSQPGRVARRRGRMVVAASAGAALCARLATAGVSAYAVADPDDAIAALRERTAEILVLAWDEERLDAVSLCRSIRTDVALGGTWIIAIADQWERAAGALAAGADDYLLRPFAVPELAIRAELGLQAARQRAGDDMLRSLMAHVPGVIYRSAWDRHYAIELISDEIERISGFPAADFVGSGTRTIMSVIHPDDADRVLSEASRATEDGLPFVLEYRIVRADGTVREVVDRGQLQAAGAGRKWMDGVIFDVTELRRAEEALRRHEVELARVQELRASRARIVAAADAARRRIERDLHDGAQQRLVNARLQLSLARRRLQTDPGDGQRLLAEMDHELLQALGELRELARGIHPATLSERGLRVAVEALAARSPVPVEVDAVPDGRFAAGVEAAAYFTVSEALTNVAKYAGDACAAVRLAVEDDCLVVEVSDDGVGGADAAGGTGLTGLADRVGAQGGALSVASPPGVGTEVRAVIPLNGTG
jgi:PAS domain S-box-containing protein